MSVHVVDSEAFADVKVYLETTESFADLLVYKTSSSSFADFEKGVWYFLTSLIILSSPLL